MASAPSPEQLKKWAEVARISNLKKERAAPWKLALAKAFRGESPEAVHQVFLATYKHYIPDSGQAEKSGSVRAAMGFFKVWTGAKKDCAKADLDPVKMANALYKFTNSDWAPVGVALGPGLDRVMTPRDYESWAKAVVTQGKKARKAGLDPVAVWDAQANSLMVRDIKDFDKTGLNPPPVRN